MKKSKGILIIVSLMIILFIFTIFLLAYAYYSDGKLFSILPYQFAGLTWNDLGHDNGVLDCNFATSSSTIIQDGEFLKIFATGARGPSKRFIETDITNIDEVLIIYEGWGQAGCTQASGNSGQSSIIGNVVGTESGIISDSINVPLSGCSSQDVTNSMTFEPSVWKFKNNFDGTWSVLQSLGVGDVFIVKDTKTIIGNVKLQLGSVGGAGNCGGETEGNNFGTTELTLYNVIIKENSFAICKADEYWQDKNFDGVPTTDECFNLTSIVLNAEEAIYESFSEKIDRIQEENEAKQAYLETQTADLSAEIQALKDAQVDINEIVLLQSKLDSLQAELDMTNEVLDGIELGDSDVIDSIILNEKLSQLQSELENDFMNRLYWIGGISLGVLIILLILLMIILIIKK